MRRHLGDFVRIDPGDAYDQESVVNAYAMPRDAYPTEAWIDDDTGMLAVFDVSSGDIATAMRKVVEVCTQ